MAAKGYAPAAWKAVRLFHEVVALLYTDDKEAIAGHKIAAFKNKGSGWAKMGVMVAVRGSKSRNFSLPR